MGNTKVVTGKVRFCYVHLFTPRKNDEGGEDKYEACLIIPKSDTAGVKKIKRAIEAAKQEGLAKFGGKVPKKLRTPLKDGDEDRDEEEFQDSYYMNVRSGRQPGIIDRDKEEILDSDEVYSGMYGRASINFYAYDFNGNKGIGAGLNNVQKLSEGEHLGGSAASAAEDFGDDFDDDEDLM